MTNCPQIWLPKLQFKKYETILRQAKSKIKAVINMHSFEIQPIVKENPQKYVDSFYDSIYGKIIVRKSSKRVLIMINKIDFKAKNLTSNAGLFLFFENAKAMGFDFIEMTSYLIMTQQIKSRNHIKTMPLWSLHWH